MKGPIDCWFCAHLGKCFHYGQKCKDFEKFNYTDLEWSVNRIAKEYGISPATLRQWFRNEGEGITLKRVEAKTKLGFRVINNNGKIGKKFLLIRVNGKEL